LQELRFGTEQYQSVTFGTSAQHGSLYRSSIRHRRATLRGKTMLEHLSDRKIMVPITGDATNTNLGDAIDQRVKETQQHEY
jgi:hypothetical protein